MKKGILKLSSLIVTIFIAFIFLSTIVNAGSFSFTVNKVLKDQDIIEGVHWNKKNITSYDEDGGSDTFLCNYVEIEPGSAEIVSWAVLAGSAIKRTSVYNIAMDYEASHPGKKVVAAINNDYFGTTNEVLSTRNPLVIDGRVVNANPDSTAKNKLYAMALNPTLTLNSDNNLPYYLTEQGASLEVTDNYYLDIVKNGAVIDTISLDEFNKSPSANGTTFTYNYVLNTQENEEMFALTTIAKSNISNTVAYNNVVGDVYYIRGFVNTDAITESSDNNVTIVSSNKTVIEELKDCSETVIYKKVAGKFAGYTSIFAAQQPTMVNGEVLAKEQIVDYGSHRDTRRARTTIGFKADGTMCFLTTDEKSTDYGLHGTSLRESASILKEYGCISAFNLDGGGSTCIYCLENGKLTLENSPSDGAVRSVGDAILVVKDDLTRDDINTTMNQVDGKVNVNVTFDKLEDSVVSVCAYANTKKIELTKTENGYSNTIKLENEVSTKVYVAVTYKTIEGKNSILTTTAENFSYTYPKIPDDFKVELDELENGKFEATISYNDYGSTVNSIKIKENDKEIEYSEFVEVDSKSFSIVVNYSNDTETKDITITDFELVVNAYENSEEDNPTEDDEQAEDKKTGCNKGTSVLSALFALPLLALICGFRIKGKKKEN